MSGNKNLYYRKPPGPCKDCAERHLGCHGECEKYQKWHKEDIAVNTQIYETKNKERETARYEVERQQRKKKVAEKSWRALK